MLRQDSSNIDPETNRANSRGGPLSPRVGDADVNIQRELDRLEDMLLSSSNIPLTRLTVIHEDQFLSQLDFIRNNLPSAFQEAEALVRRRQEMIHGAEQQAQQLLESAKRRADQILNELGIIQQAKQEAQQIQQQVQQEVRTAREQTRQELEQMRQQVRQELEEQQRQTLADCEARRRQTLSECEAVQSGADEYSDRVLANLERQLSEMLRVIQNGRQQLRRSPAVSLSMAAPSQKGAQGRAARTRLAPPPRPQERSQF